VEKRPQIFFISNKQQEKWITECVDSGTAVATKCIEDAETAIKQEQDDLRTTEVG
jgi:hypothetical protein